MEQVKINKFRQKTGFDKFFSRVNIMSYLWGYKKILGVDVNSKVVTEKNGITLYISKEDFLKINEEIKKGEGQILVDLIPPTIHSRKRLFESIFSNKVSKDLEQDLERVIGYKYIFEKYVNCVSNPVIESARDSTIYPHKFFIEDKEYSQILTKYGFLFGAGKSVGAVKKYFELSQEKFQDSDLTTAIKLGFTISEEEDYLIALVFHLMHR